MHQDPAEKSQEPVSDRLADALWNKVQKPDTTRTPTNDSPAMDFKDRHTQFAPTVILDFDNGVDFTFKGMGLKGNR